MASPQLEDGFTRIANEIVEAMTRLVLNSSESRCLFVIFRKTFGYHKKSDRISLSQFAEATSMTRSHAYRALLSLEERKIITTQPDGQYKVYAFQKNYEQWDSKGPQGRTTVPQIGNTSTVPQIGNCTPNRVQKCTPNRVQNCTLNRELQKKERKGKEKNQGSSEMQKIAKPKKETNPLIREVTAGINEAYGEAYPEWPKHVRAISQLLKLEYTVAEIVGCWGAIYKQGDGRFPPLTWVIDRIRSYRQNGNKLPERNGQASGNNKRYPGPARTDNPEEYYRADIERAERAERQRQERARVLPSA